jgi:inorganic pyrophosphatase
MLRLDRVLYTATHYPANYGFIPRTYADDNDPLDVLVLCQENVDPMTLVECYPIGVITMIDSQQNDEKIIAVAKKDPFLNVYKDIDELPNHISAEIMHFFEVYKQLEEKQTVVEKVLGREEAERIIKKAIDNYNEKFGEEALQVCCSICCYFCCFPCYGSRLRALLCSRQCMRPSCLR